LVPLKPYLLLLQAVAVEAVKAVLLLVVAVEQVLYFQVG
jgi:hypothetical protein